MNSYADFLVRFDPASIPLLYKDWDWLIDGKSLNKPLAMNCFGDLFYKDDQGKVYFLDTLEGQILEFADNEADISSKLDDPASQNHYLSTENVELLRERGQVLKDDELYIYVPHPILNEHASFDSIQIMSLRVVISINGQCLRQVTAHERADTVDHHND